MSGAGSPSGSRRSPIGASKRSPNLALSKFLRESFTSEPPYLYESLSGNPRLQKLGDLVQNLLAFGRDNAISGEAVESLELALRHMVHETVSFASTTIQSTVSVTKVQESSHSLDTAKVNAELEELKLENAELKGNLKSSEEQVSILRSRTRDLQEELNSLSSRSLSYKQEFELAAQERMRYAALEEKYHDLLGRLKVGETTKANLEEQIKKANAEYSAAFEDLKKARQLISKKREKLASYKAENQKLKILLEEKEEELIIVELQSSVERDRSQRRSSCSEQDLSVNREELRLNAENGRLASVIQELTEQKGQLEKEKDTMEEEKSDLLRQVNDMKNDMSEKVSECEALREQLTTRSQEVEELATENDELRAELDTVRRSLKKAQKHPDGKPPLPPAQSPTKDGDQTFVDRLKEWVNGYAAFITYLIDHDEVELHLLNGVPKFPERMAALLTEKINQSLRFVRRTGMAGNIPLFDAAFGNPEATAVLVKSLEASEDYLPAFSVFATITNKLIAQIEANAKRVEKICQLLHIDTSSEDKMLDDVFKYHMDHQPLFDKVVAILESKFEVPINRDNILACLDEFVNESTEIVDELQNELGEYVAPSCKPVEIPRKVLEYITSMNVALEQARARLSDGKTFQNELREAQSNLSIMNDKLEASEIHKNQLSLRLKEKEASILRLTEQLEDSMEAKMGTDQALRSLRVMNAELESTCHILRNERDRLKLALSDKAATFEERLEEALSSEKKRCREELERQAKKNAADQDAIRLELEEKSKKLADAKSLVLDLQQRFNEKKEKYHKLLTSLQKQNEVLVKQKNESGSLSPEDRKLMKTANSQRRQMLAKLNELSPTKSGMDSSLSLDDNLVEDLGQMLQKCFESTSGWTGRTVKKAVGILIDRVLSSLSA